MARFVTTHWSMILEGRHDPHRAREALVEICASYRRPVLSYLRERGYAPADAEDLAQEFFARLVEQRWDLHADPGRGRFRSFLLTALHRFLANERAGRNACKRGGGQHQVGLDDVVLEAPASQTPEQAFDHAWAMTVLEHAGDRLEQEARAAGRETLFRALSDFLIEAPDESDYAHVAIQLDMKPNTVAQHVRRLRLRLRELIREELFQTVTDADGLDTELSALRRIVGADAGA